MEIRIVRDTKKVEDEEAAIRAAITWATLVQETTNKVWTMKDEQIAEMVKDEIDSLLTFDATHDEWGNAVNAVEVLVGKGGYSVSTVFDTTYPIDPITNLPIIPEVID